ncbi:MAG: DNA polymerase III subunit delta [Hyphomicrobiaceae bacterium]
MTAIRTHQVSGFLAGLTARAPALLFYGLDAGLVAERARRAAERLAALETPPGEIVRLDDSDLERDSGRLSVELQTVPMFGSRKIVRATAGRRITAALLKPLVESGRLAGHLIVEAGALKSRDALRSLFESSSAAAAIACYTDAPQDLDGMVRDVLSAAGLDISSDARQLLIGRLGADRALSRAEVEKLALYCHGRRRIETEDVEAVIGDAAEQTFDRILAAAAAGQSAETLVECDRAMAAGENPQAVIVIAQRHFHRLHRVRAALDAGASLEEAMRVLRPPLYGKHKSTFEAQVRLWSLDRLTQILGVMAEVSKTARLTSALETALMERLLLQTAQLARKSAIGHR